MCLQAGLFNADAFVAPSKILSLLLTFAMPAPADLQGQPVAMLGVVTASEGETALPNYLPLLWRSTSTL